MRRSNSYETAGTSGSQRAPMVKLGVVHALVDVVAKDAGRCPVEAAGALRQLARTGRFYRDAVMTAAGEKVDGAALLGLVGQLYTSRSS